VSQGRVSLGSMALEDTGWRPLSSPVSGRSAFNISAFTRLARAHATTVAGDTLVALALADSVFFSMPSGEARLKVAGYLALTMAPFAVVAPLIGPWLDRVRGGRRWIAFGANAARVLICLLMIRDINNLALYPEAFSLLVLSKTYHVAKSALVPTVVGSESELVLANSRLSLLSGIMSLVAAAPGGLALLLAGSQGPLWLASAVFVGAAVLVALVPGTQVAKDPETTLERQELHGGGILLAASAMGLLRGIVGFLTFLLAFELRDDSWKLGVALGASAASALLGSFLAPKLRESLPEERMLQLVLVITAVAGLGGTYIGDVGGAALVAAAVGFSSSAGKLAFDAIVQRDAPDANRGRSFARFETRFQLVWVIGALIPALWAMPARLGFFGIAGCAGFALVSYLAGQKAVAAGRARRRRVDPAQMIRRAREHRQQRQQHATAHPAPTPVPHDPTLPRPPT
jgi:MFS transporter